MRMKEFDIKSYISENKMNNYLFQEIQNEINLIFKMLYEFSEYKKNKINLNEVVCRLNNLNSYSKYNDWVIKGVLIENKINNNNINFKKWLLNLDGLLIDVGIKRNDRSFNSDEWKIIEDYFEYRKRDFEEKYGNLI